MLIRFDTCTHISVSDVSIFQCGSWCMHLKNSRDIFLTIIHIQNEKQDGFDIDSCQNVSIPAVIWNAETMPPSSSPALRT